MAELFFSMEGHVFIGNNRSEDVKLLCSLSDSELDALVRLKKLVLQRVAVVERESLGKKIDLKWLRVLAFILMQRVKVQLKDLQITEASVLEEALSRLSMLKLDVEDSNATDMETDDVMQ